MTMRFLKWMLNVVLVLAAAYGVSLAAHQSTILKIVSPIASAVWGS